MFRTQIDKLKDQFPIPQGGTGLIHEIEVPMHQRCTGLIRAIEVPMRLRRMDSIHVFEVSIPQGGTRQIRPTNSIIQYRFIGAPTPEGVGVNSVKFKLRA